MAIEIEGMAEFVAAMDKLARSAKPDKIEPILRSGAHIITKAARKVAPVRKATYNGWRPGKRSKLPGVLKRAVKTKKLNRAFGNPAPSISAIDRKAAPHAHLVHDSDGKRRIGKRGHRPYRGRSFGIMPKDEFFADTWKTYSGHVLRSVESDVKKLIEGAVK